MFKSGDVILASVQFADSFEVKTRPALVLFEERGNIVVAGITSNPAMDGIKLSVEEGAVKESIIKLNSIFTLSSLLVKRKLFALGSDKKKEVLEGLTQRLQSLHS